MRSIEIFVDMPCRNRPHKISANILFTWQKVDKLVDDGINKYWIRFCPNLDFLSDLFYYY